MKYELKHIELDNPIVVFDLETTGLSVTTARVVEIAMIKILPDGYVEEDMYTTIINPQIHIPEDASKVHGLSDKDVKDAPKFAEVAPEILAFLSGCHIGGYNILRYDLPILKEEFMRHCRVTLSLGEDTVILDGLKIFRHFEPYTLQRALSYYCGKELEEAHEAIADAQATADVLLAQIDRYRGDCTSLQEFDRLVRGNQVDRDGQVRWSDEGKLVLTFGKHSGRPLWELPRDYLKWLLDNTVIRDSKIKDILRRVLRGVEPPTREEYV